MDASGGINFIPPGWTTLDFAAWFKPSPSVEVAVGLYNLSDEKYWLWNDVRGLTGVTASFDRYTQLRRNVAINVRCAF